MKQFVFVLAIAGLAAADASAQARAADAAAPILKAVPPVSFVPSSAFFLGVGGGYNVSDFGSQNVFAVGTSNVFQNGLLTSSGSGGRTCQYRNELAVRGRLFGAGRLFPALLWQ